MLRVVLILVRDVGVCGTDKLEPVFRLLSDGREGFEELTSEPSDTRFRQLIAIVAEKE